LFVVMLGVIMLSFVMLNVVILNVVMLSTIILSVVAPTCIKYTWTKLSMQGQMLKNFLRLFVGNTLECLSQAGLSRIV
jgi:hypothetical protein